MCILSYSDYEKKILDFVSSNGGLNYVATSDMRDNTYHKTWICNNGKALHETNRIVTKIATAEIYGIKIPVEVQLFESEQFNDVDATSYFHYDKALTTKL